MTRVDSHELHRRAHTMRARQMAYFALRALRALRRAFFVHALQIPALRSIG